MPRWPMPSDTEAFAEKTVPPCATSSRMVGSVAPSNGATLPVLVGGCHGVMRPEEVAHVAHRLLNVVLGVLPRVDAHFSLGRQTHGRTKSRVTVKTKSAFVRYILLRKASTMSMVISGRRSQSAGPQPFMLLW